jgi:hypothetical protein
MIASFGLDVCDRATPVFIQAAINTDPEISTRLWFICFSLKNVCFGMEQVMYHQRTCRDPIQSDVNLDNGIEKTTNSNGYWRESPEICVVVVRNSMISASLEWRPME